MLHGIETIKTRILTHESVIFSFVSLFTEGIKLFLWYTHISPNVFQWHLLQTIQTYAQQAIINKFMNNATFQNACLNATSKVTLVRKVAVIYKD